MKIDTTDIGLFSVKVSYEDGYEWLMNKDSELGNVNSAIDEAISHVGNYGRAFVLIEISKPRTAQPFSEEN
jgi:hypothetical protein